MTFWCGSRSTDPCLWLMDPDPAIFVIDLKVPTKFFFLVFSAYYFLNVHLHNLSKIKSQKEVTIKVFLFIFAWWWPKNIQTDPDSDSDQEHWFTVKGGHYTKLKTSSGGGGTWYWPQLLSSNSHDVGVLNLGNRSNRLGAARGFQQPFLPFRET